MFHYSRLVSYFYGYYLYPKEGHQPLHRLNLPATCVNTDRFRSKADVPFTTMHTIHDSPHVNIEIFSLENFDKINYRNAFITNKKFLRVRIK